VRASSSGAPGQGCEGDRGEGAADQLLGLVEELLQAAAPRAGAGAVPALDEQAAAGRVGGLEGLEHVEDADLSGGTGQAVAAPDAARAHGQARR
jgi:hypothetical protein